MPNDFVASLSRTAANPAAARSSASSQEAGRSRPLSRTSGSVSRTCLLIEHTFLTSNCRHIETTVGVQTGVHVVSRHEYLSGRAGDRIRRTTILIVVGHMRTLSERGRRGGRRVVLSGRTARRRVTRITLPGDGRPGGNAARADFLAGE